VKKFSVWAGLPFFSQRIWQNKKHPTKRAADGWDSARFISIFLALSLYYSQAIFSPAAANANRWALILKYG